MHRAAPLTTPLTKGPNTCGSQYASKRRRAPPGARAAALPAGLEHLDLQGNWIGTKGAVAVAAALPAGLEHLSLSEHAGSFRQQAVDGKMLTTLSESDLRDDLGVSQPLHRRRLLMEIDALRAAAPPPAPPPLRRDPSEPARGVRLVEVTEPLELHHLCEHVKASCRDPNRSESFEVVRVDRVDNPYLSYKLEATARQLLSPKANRAVPPQGGYFHGTSRENALSICELGFDDKRWMGGKFGVGQYLSGDATRASPKRYTQESNMLLLTEAVLGAVWTLRPGEARHALDATSVRAHEYDSIAVPESDEVVVYLKFQAVPRYVIYFERLGLPPASPTPPGCGPCPSSGPSTR